MSILNKKEVEELIPIAYQELKKNEIICKEGKINKRFRSQIASFGSAIAMGNLLSAVTFFSQNGEAKVQRTELLNVIWSMLIEKYKVEGGNLKDYVLKQNEQFLSKERIINCAIAIKLAINLFELVEEEEE